MPLEVKLFSSMALNWKMMLKWQRKIQSIWTLLTVKNSLQAQTKKLIYYQQATPMALFISGMSASFENTHRDK